MTTASPIVVPAEALVALVSRMFVAAGIGAKTAMTVAEGLVEADLDGLPSHGVLLVEMYVDRLRGGSVSTREKAEIVSDRGATLVLDAGHALGQLTGDQAMRLAATRAKQYGVGIVAVRHAFHFGAARRYVAQAVAEGCIGIAMCNTRPLMPAPGGAERVVGNNPIAIAVPSDDDIPIVLDMATSAVAMGKIRLAEKAGQAIPETWAVRADGSATTDPKEAIAGMLLPAAGPKGFGLAFMIDLLCGLLSGGASGEKVKPLYGDPSVPYDCSHLFMAIDVGHFCDPAWFRREAAAAAAHIRAGARAPGVAQLFVPGEPEWRRRAEAGDKVTLDPALADYLIKIAQDLGVSVEPLLSLLRDHAGKKHHAQT